MNSPIIILVDDDPINNLICRKKLTKAYKNLEVKEFVSARKGLDFFLQNPIHKANLLLLDINMPDINAWDFLNELRNADIKIIVVIITSSIDQDDIERASQYEEIEGYLIKPLTEKKIEQIIGFLN